MSCDCRSQDMTAGMHILEDFRPGSDTTHLCDGEEAGVRGWRETVVVGSGYMYFGLSC